MASLALCVVAEDVRVAPQHLCIDPIDDVTEVEIPAFLRHAGIKNDLEQQIPEFVT